METFVLIFITVMFAATMGIFIWFMFKTAA
ncbi:hypothetical protein HELA111659_08005 [Helicobacter labetoulli]